MPLGVNIEVDLSGVPLAQGNGGAILDAWMVEVKESFARQGLSQIGYWMDVFFRDPTPFYETQVTIDRRGDDRVIHDRGVIYGPWLAGVGSRNAPSSFKGYTHWRRTFQWLENEEGPRIIDRHLPKLVDRLGGS
jgi:hypothetical protein